MVRLALKELSPHEVSLDPAAYRVLMDRRWPDNLRELRAVLQQALLAAGDGGILPAHLPALRETAKPARASFAIEREWILDGLRRNRFRRGEAARFLGVSRKTLYNKMVALGMLVPDGKPLPRSTHRRGVG